MTWILERVVTERATGKILEATTEGEFPDMFAVLRENTWLNDMQLIRKGLFYRPDILASTLERCVGHNLYEVKQIP
jgi:hypothetical protein